MDMKTVTFNLFMKTGGPQPETLDQDVINMYLIDNFAKKRGCSMGFNIRSINFSYLGEFPPYTFLNHILITFFYWP
jgi:hypothetical protein